MIINVFANLNDRQDYFNQNYHAAAAAPFTAFGLYNKHICFITQPMTLSAMSDETKMSLISVVK